MSGRRCSRRRAKLQRASLSLGSVCSACPPPALTPYPRIHLASPHGLHPVPSSLLPVFPSSHLCVVL
eukprot:531360-Rhodomonas_salina.1